MSEYERLAMFPWKDGTHPPRILFSPGDAYESPGRRWRGSPSVERAANGRLWAAWTSGADGPGPGNSTVLVTSDDGGATWSEPVLAIDPGPGRRAFAPCLWHDPRGRLWFFWSQCGEDAYYDGRAGVWALRTETTTSLGPTPLWMSAGRICDGVMPNKPTVRAGGEWLLPVALWDLPGGPVRPGLRERRGSGVVVSDDGGRTWTWRGAAVDVPCRGFDDHMIVERGDGGLRMLVRAQYGIARSESSDGGATWTNGRATALDAPDARFFVRRLASGRLLLIARRGSAARSRLAASLSENDGATWPHTIILDGRTGAGSPDAVQAPDGTIRAIYELARGGDTRAAHEILLAAFTEEDILAGRPPRGPRLRRTVSPLPRA